MVQVPEQAVAARGQDPADELLRCFGRQIKLFRERAGLTQAALGPLLGYSEAQVAAIEQGRRIARPDTIEKLDTLLEADGVLLAMKRAVALTRYPAFFRDAARIEEEAVEFHAYAVLAVPGLLQTEEYARTMFTVWRPRRREDEIEQMVAARMARHKIYERKPAPTLSFVIEESVLERPFGGADVLRGQLEHMLLVAENPHVEIQVMPTRVADHAGADGPFTMMTPEGGEQVAYVESQGNGRVIAKRESVRGFAVRYGILRAQALSPAESVRHIEKLLQGDL
ncbi:helix-turn-helix domain-containing protein [Streptomyces cellulosae]|mgnify:CR=1 FL=1|uniref:Scr1 family TA system antitoxin-like transcriptional regulator n=1 Tax=Streptomyces TaxID=1883 RepID=UPI0019288F9E|nr:helix-turn-helix domain-containing protein [Streptomyces cellulosae]WTB83303.1 helix-turn-helix domain-containing protein [Streptomyces cellulosae]WTC57505.1 helix-turn-helix domain-containing protein [Streptomyces cellulosae]